MISTKAIKYKNNKQIINNRKQFNREKKIINVYINAKNFGLTILYNVEI